MTITLDGSEGISLEVIVAAGCCQHEAVTRLRCELGKKLQAFRGWNNTMQQGIE